MRPLQDQGQPDFTITINVKRSKCGSTGSYEALLINTYAPQLFLPPTKPATSKITLPHWNVFIHSLFLITHPHWNVFIHSLFLNISELVFVIFHEMSHSVCLMSLLVEHLLVAHAELFILSRKAREHGFVSGTCQKIVTPEIEHVVLGHCWSLS